MGNEGRFHQCLEVISKSRDIIRPWIGNRIETLACQLDPPLRGGLAQFQPRRHAGRQARKALHVGNFSATRIRGGHDRHLLAKFSLRQIFQHRPGDLFEQGYP
jgi:hypothetical protein